MLGSHSYLAVPGEDATPILAEERAQLLRIFPDGVMDEPYRVDLTVVRAWAIPAGPAQRARAP